MRRYVLIGALALLLSLTVVGCAGLRSRRWIKNVDQQNAAAEFIRRAGYSCDTVSEMYPQNWVNPTYTVRCNENRYTYTLQDQGGTWVVILP